MATASCSRPHPIRALRRGVTIGYVPQAPVFPDGATARDVVVTSILAMASPSAGDEVPRRVAKVLGRTGFARVGSGGMSARSP